MAGNAEQAPLDSEGRHHAARKLNPQKTAEFLSRPQSNSEFVISILLWLEGLPK